MCTYRTEKIEIEGSGKGAQGWFGLTHATVAGRSGAAPAVTRNTDCC